MDYSAEIQADFKTDQKSCTKCAENMEEGFIADYTHGSSDSGIVQNVWVQGELQINWIGSTKLKDQKKFKATTFRCVNCGYLESFAIEQQN